MSEPLGWNVYYGSNGQDVRFDHFEPNEPALSRAAEKFANEVEAFSRQPGPGGQLTPGIIGRAMDELWMPPRPAGRTERMPFAAGSLEVSGTFSIEFTPEAAEAFLAMLRPKCGALLFPLPPRAPRPVEPVHPLDAPYFAPVQGPQPAACALDEGHRIGWHWCDGTWWR